MTLPCERTRAVCRARQFLYRLASPYCGGIKGIRREVREEARRILRHFPAWFDLGMSDAFDQQAASACGSEEDGGDWLRETAVAKPLPKRKRA